VVLHCHALTSGCQGGEWPEAGGQAGGGTGNW